MKNVILLFLFTLMPLIIFAQRQLVSGSVQDEGGAPLPGVNIVVKGTLNGTATDVDGNFSLEVSSENTLVFSSVGYVQEEVLVGNQTQVNLKLRPDVSAMDEIVVIGYGTQKKTSLTASVSTLDTKDLRSVNVANSSNAIVGRVPGLITVQNSGEVGSDQANILVRGIGTTGNSAPLIVVDGVPRNSLNEIDFNNVESYSVLKDAAAVAPYGLGGANGVILITTKTGKKGKPMFTFNQSTGFQNPTFLTPYANAFQYVDAYNQAETNVGVPLENRRYSQEDLNTYRRLVETGDPSIDRNLYGNTNAFDFLLNSNAVITNQNLSVSGGNEYLTFYSGINYISQQGMWDKSNLNRVGLVNNLTYTPTSKTSINLSINGFNENLNAPSIDGNQVFNIAQRFVPTNPIFYSNGNIAAGDNGVILPTLTKLGTRNRERMNLLSQVSIEQEVLPGLKIKGAFSYDIQNTNNKNWNEPQEVFYSINTSTDPYTFNEIGNDDRYSLSQSLAQFKSYTYQGIINYNRSFKLHNVTFLGVIERRQTENSTFGASRSGYNLPIEELNFGSPDKDLQANFGNSFEAAQIGYVYRIGYQYNNKFLFEAAGRYDGHYFFAPDKRFGFFPSFSAGYRISQEPFFENVNFVDELKIRGSWGQSGNLAGGPNQFSSRLILYGDSFPFGGSATQGIYAAAEANPNITWEKSMKYNVGLEFSLFDGLIISEIDVFYEERNNMLLNPSSEVPQEYGIGLSQVNAGRMNNRGFDFQIQSGKTFNNELRFDLTLVTSFARNKLLEIFENEVTKNDPNRTRTGRPFQSNFGLVSLGLFQTEDDVNGDGVITAEDGFPAHNLGGVVRPGNIRYEDLNNDGVINLQDETQIGFAPTPEVIYSIMPSVSFKGFDFSCMFQGAARSSTLLEGTLIRAFAEPRNITVDLYNNSWTPDNQNALYPIIRPTGLIANDDARSSFWHVRTDYVRLKFMELGYTFPSQMISRMKLSQLRLFVSGTNLWTKSNTRNLFDPEIDGASVAEGVGRAWYTPQQSVFSFGVNVNF